MRTFDWFFENTGWQRDEPLFGVELFDIYDEEDEDEDDDA